MKARIKADKKWIYRDVDFSIDDDDCRKGKLLSPATDSKGDMVDIGAILTIFVDSPIAVFQAEVYHKAPKAIGESGCRIALKDIEKIHDESDDVSALPE